MNYLFEHFCFIRYTHNGSLQLIEDPDSGIVYSSSIFC